MIERDQKAYKNLDFNPQFKRALTLLNDSDANVFVMGKAGTGKSTFLSYFRDNTKKKIAVLAPTGVAAVNIQGQTIHSFFKFKPNVTLDSIKRKKKRSEKPSIYQSLDIIIIDEISMVRADLIDCVDRFLRLNGPQEGEAFGGIQMVFIGDLYQLPPVVLPREREIFTTHYTSPYFFSAHFFAKFKMQLIELEHVYRQKDQGFIDILNAIRNNSVTDRHLEQLNKRVEPDYVAPKDDFSIYLVPTNAAAEKLNAQKLDELAGDKMRFEGKLTGSFTEGQMPTQFDLELKPHAQIMMVNNDLGGRWVNGTLGKVLNFSTNSDGQPYVRVELESGASVNIVPYQWKMYQFQLEGNVVTTKTVGTFVQLPMKLAWAITIHKSQGKTFNKAVIDIGHNIFSAGQTYVALSRCTNLEGMVLKKPIEKRHIWTDQNIVNFITSYQYQVAAQLCSLPEKIALLKNAIASKAVLDITYLRAKDEKTRRRIIPLEVGEMTSKGVVFQGMLAYCQDRKIESAYRIEQILEIKLAS